jgi:hypothetical protein
MSCVSRLAVDESHNDVCGHQLLFPHLIGKQAGSVAPYPLVSVLPRMMCNTPPQLDGCACSDIVEKTPTDGTEKGGKRLPPAPPPQSPPPGKPKIRKPDKKEGEKDKQDENEPRTEGVRL